MYLGTKNLFHVAILTVYLHKPYYYYRVIFRDFHRDFLVNYSFLFFVIDELNSKRLRRVDGDVYLRTLDDTKALLKFHWHYMLIL